MTQSRREKAFFWALFAFLFFLFMILPSIGGTIFASPDETAYARVAEQIALHHRVFLPDHVVGAFPWVHPRSWISLGDKMAPVGFLGWPWVLSFFAGIGGVAFLPWIGSLLLLSASWPFFRLLLARFGFWPAWLGTLVAFTVPSMILYGNRSLFPNGAVLALAVWVFWLIDFLIHTRAKKTIWYFIISFLAVLCLAMRPIEALWILPWWIFAGKLLRPTRRGWIAMACGILLVLLPLGWYARGAYGSFFGIGYGRADQITAKTQMVTSVVSLSAPVAPASSVWWLPYGFHPRILLWNIGAYFGWLFLPWTILAVAAIAHVLWRIKRECGWKKVNPYFLLILWTLFILLLVYGSGMYIDRFGPRQATIANSFLRYLLPISVFIGLAFAYLSRLALERKSWRTACIAAAVFLAVFGMYRATFADDEGVFSTRTELIRYASIEQSLSAWFRPGDLILSDRSDKIFFPTYRAVSPLPPPELVRNYARGADIRIGLFVRPLSQKERDEWQRAGFEIQELASFSRERLYRLFPTP
ncbi:MAG TPA: hypothetical protein VFQ60_05405 [Patescibacteria group bacterium]|nr:hypothetical protein [Patescibacteria group bacterium]